MYDFDKIVHRENTNCVKYDLREWFFDSKDVIPMWVADMDFETPAFILEDIKKRLDHPVLGYSIRSDEYHKSIINWLEKRHNWKIELDWICFSPGVVPAINLLVLELTNPKDKIVVQPPVYFPFFAAINSHNRTQVDNPLFLKNGRLHIDFEDLDKKLMDAKVLIICNPHNPGGSVWTKDELAKIGELCIKHDVWILSDEIHADLVLKSNKHTSMASVSKEIAKRTITFMAASKTFNLAGLSTAYVIIEDEKLREKYNYALMEQMHISQGNIFGAVALESAFTKGQQWLNELLDYIQNNIAFAIAYLETNIEGIKAIKPEATYMLWLDCRELGLDDDELKNFFVKKAKVGLNTGTMFGQGGSGFMRMNLACPRKVLKQALDQIKKAADQL